MKIIYTGLITLAIILTIPLTLLPSAGFAAEYTFTTIDVPDAIGTEAKGMNNAGDIVGYYHDANVGGGFLDVGGSFTPISVPGSSVTSAYGINNARNIVGQCGGYYDGLSFGFYGFLYAGEGFTVIDVPGSSYRGASGINDSGNIVGFYQDIATGEMHGFLYAGGQYTTINVPGASFTRASGINNAGDIVGYYQDSMGWHGFLYAEGGFTTIDVPDSFYTYAYAINDSGSIVGVYSLATGGAHGFLYVGGKFTTIDVPGAQNTSASGINHSGDIVGFYEDASGSHGFLATSIPVTIIVGIDIKPTSINLRKTSQISVSIFSTTDFNAVTQIEPNSLTFGLTGSEDSLNYCVSKPKDLNRDGIKDLLCYFYIDHTGFQCGQNLGILNGYTVGGVPIKGADSVTLIHCN